jgi:hypothetical protein
LEEVDTLVGLQDPTSSITVVTNRPTEQVIVARVSRSVGRGGPLNMALSAGRSVFGAGLLGLA